MKAIILFSLYGDYRGGAEKRYLSLFNYLQEHQSDYVLILNKTLYQSCINDNILSSSKNVLCINSLLEKSIDLSYKKQKTKIIDHESTKKKGNKIINVLKRLKYYLKVWVDVLYVSVQIHKLITRNHITHFYTIFQSGMYLTPYFKLFRKKYIYSENDCSLSFIDNNELSRWKSEYKSLKNALYIDCLSPQIKKDLLNLPFINDVNKLLVTPNSFINYNNFSPVSEKENIITFCSRIEKLKNPELLIDSIALIKSQLRDYKIYIIGDGNMFGHIQECIKKKSLSNIVYLTGGLATPYKYISKSKIFISLQQNNNYPSQSLLEAMACENAIIASDVGETRMLVTEDEGILVNLDKQSVADAILTLINQPSLCLKLGKRARCKAVVEHSIEKFAEYFNEIMSK
ncbi:MAG: glycosyltransferase [Pleomorphochaeta sp.]